MLASLSPQGHRGCAGDLGVCVKARIQAGHFGIERLPQVKLSRQAGREGMGKWPKKKKVTPQGLEP